MLKSSFEKLFSHSVHSGLNELADFRVSGLSHGSTVLLRLDERRVGVDASLPDDGVYGDGQKLGEIGNDSGKGVWYSSHCEVPVLDGMQSSECIYTVGYVCTRGNLNSRLGVVSAAREPTRRLLQIVLWWEESWAAGKANFTPIEMSHDIYYIHHTRIHPFT